jgi:pimeloyl-ACP methyl ester carboxylesterase
MKTLTERLYASLSQPKRLWVFENAGHSDWADSPELVWWDEVMDFLNSKP